jgi:hypothetical protein
MNVAFPGASQRPAAALEGIRHFAAAGPHSSPAPGVSYQPGVCNIGPAEIARRRMAGHLGLIATVVLFAVLVAIGAPPPVRLLVVLPATMAAAGYLQAWFRFCAAFGSRGVFNFDQVGRLDRVEGEMARRRDRRRATRIGLASLAIGVAVGIFAVMVLR